MVTQVVPLSIPPNIVWQAIPGTSQEYAIETRAHHTLYYGTRGPGKTITQLMRFRRRVGLGYGSYWRGIILDREQKPLDDIIAQGERFFPKFNDGVKFKKSGTSYKWVWPTGEELLLRHAKNIDDYDKYHGHEYPYIGWNELTKYPTPDLYLKMMSVNRCSFDPEEHTPHEWVGTRKVYKTQDGKALPPIPLEVFSTTNTNGAGHTWVKDTFIDVCPVGTMYRKSFDVYNPKTQKEETFERKQVAIFGSYKENKYLTPDYVAGLNELTANNPNLRKAWLEGSWDVSSGGAFDDVWDTETHRILPFYIPHNWYVDRSFDWGSSTPYAVNFWAESNGEEFKWGDGTTRCVPRGSLFCISEIYGGERIGYNKGLRHSAFEIADLVKQREYHLVTSKMLDKRPVAGPADNQIRDVTQSDEMTIEQKMTSHGVNWTASDKSNGSRVVGLSIARDMLKAARDKLDEPHLYFFNTCVNTIKTLSSLPMDEDKPEDVDTDAEDHHWDSCRYRILKSGYRYARHIRTKHATPGY